MTTLTIDLPLETIADSIRKLDIKDKIKLLSILDTDIEFFDDDLQSRNEDADNRPEIFLSREQTFADFSVK